MLWLPPVGAPIFDTRFCTSEMRFGGEAVTTRRICKSTRRWTVIVKTSRPGLRTGKLRDAHVFLYCSFTNVNCRIFKCVDPARCDKHRAATDLQAFPTWSAPAETRWGFAQGGERPHRWPLGFPWLETGPLHQIIWHHVGFGAKAKFSSGWLKLTKAVIELTPHQMRKIAQQLCTTAMHNSYALDAWELGSPLSKVWKGITPISPRPWRNVLCLAPEKSEKLWYKYTVITFQLAMKWWGTWMKMRFWTFNASDLGATEICTEFWKDIRVLNATGECQAPQCLGPPHCGTARSRKQGHPLTTINYHVFIHT